MAFIIQGLDPSLFGSLFDQKQAAPSPNRGTVYQVDAQPGFPCRISLDDVPIGEEVMLVSYQHHAADTAYAQCGPIFISAKPALPGRYVDDIPPALARRTLSLRAYDAGGMMVDAALVEGQAAKPAILAMFENPLVARIDAHNATRGCFAAHIRRHSATSS